MQPYNEYIQSRTEKIDDTYLEVPPSWESIVKSCLSDICDIVRMYNQDINKLTFEQIKEKYGELRVYYTTPYQNFFIESMLNNKDSDIPEDIFNAHNRMCQHIDSVIDRYNMVIKSLNLQYKPIDKRINNKL